jgi:hypothetical protein
MVDLDVKYAWIASVACFFVYVLVYIYLDAVIPNSFGLRQHPLFCFKKALPTNTGLEPINNDSDAVLQL